MDFSHIIAEDKIKKAIREGEFDNLPGRGKPLVLEDLSAIPEDLRMAYKMMKNAGMIVDEGSYKKEFMQIEDLLANCKDSQQKKELERQLTEKRLRYQKYKQKNSSHSSVFREYENKLNDLLS
ncbi:DUF1992 domain-containing protein [Peribacillus saganii]|uniref:DUF1992 domain-containing protein n=1 Tax=Peribacillus saganii TaxID=2303992 RepID=A0A372LMP1_9BACI|nr:DUF1992 domain-containing protein [Peribacillus saganii]RFU67926.1 DUF1992 domain-containing protein [Peribacillus saganii]